MQRADISVCSLSNKEIHDFLYHIKDVGHFPFLNINDIDIQPL